MISPDTEAVVIDYGMGRLDDGEKLELLERLVDERLTLEDAQETELRGWASSIELCVCETRTGCRRCGGSGVRLRCTAFVRAIRADLIAALGL